MRTIKFRAWDKIEKKMIEMTLELAERIGKAALAKANEMGRPMSVSVVDESGRLVYFSRAMLRPLAFDN